jgi:hypothetical protein
MNDHEPSQISPVTANAVLRPSMGGALMPKASTQQTGVLDDIA